MLAAPGSTSNVVGFAYESGAAMVGGFTAPARRVGLGYRDSVVADLTELLPTPGRGRWLRGSNCARPDGGTRCPPILTGTR